MRKAFGCIGWQYKFDKCAGTSKSKFNFDAFVVCKLRWPCSIKVSLNILYWKSFAVFNIGFENREENCLKACFEVCVLGTDSVWVLNLNWWKLNESTAAFCEWSNWVKYKCHECWCEFVQDKFGDSKEIKGDCCLAINTLIIENAVL